MLSLPAHKLCLCAFFLLYLIDYIRGLTYHILKGLVEIMIILRCFLLVYGNNRLFMFVFMINL